MKAQYKATIEGMTVQSGMHNSTTSAWMELKMMIASAYGISFSEADDMMIGNTVLVVA